MKVKITASYSGVIATGSYENSRPGYAVEVEIELKEGEDVLQVIEREQQRLQAICYGNFRADETRQIVERVQKQRADMRWYEGYPSVTSVINWDADFFMPPEELQQYSSQGNLIDAQAKEFVKTGKVVPVEKIQGTWTDIVIVKQGNLGLSLSGWDVAGFFKKFPITKMELGVPVISKKHQYGGTPDVRKCEWEGKKYLLDFKRTCDKVKNGMQCSAYIMAEEENGESPYDGFIIAILNDKTDQGFSKPWIVTGREEISQYFGMFTDARVSFRKRFGV